MSIPAASNRRQTNVLKMMKHQHGPSGIDQVKMPYQSLLGAGFIGIDNLGSGLDLMGLFGPFTTAAPLIP